MTYYQRRVLVDALYRAMYIEEARWEAIPLVEDAATLRVYLEHLKRLFTIAHASPDLLEESARQQVADGLSVLGEVMVELRRYEPRVA